MDHRVVMDERIMHRRIIEACQQGDREAFRGLFDAYKDRVYSIALCFFHGDEATAEDVTQEVFLRLFSSIGQFQHKANFTTWLYRLVTNVCLDEQRKRKRCFPLEALGDRGEGAVGLPPTEPYTQFEINDSIQSALAELSPDLRATILLKYYEELSYEEMARVLNCPQGTIASRLNRSLKLLAQKLSHLRGAFTSGE
jgi:RNA polymerase sigma-70 factor (ECF subfamily)